MNRIVNVARSERVSMVWTEAMVLRPHGRLAPLVKWVWKLLKKYKQIEDYWEPKSTFTYHQIDTGYFMDRLFKSRETVLEFSQDEPDLLLIGNADYRELVGAVMDSAEHRFGFHAEYVMNTSGRRRILGLEVVVLPWVKGMVAINRRSLNL
jgi:hypothetical protein